MIDLTGMDDVLAALDAKIAQIEAGAEVAIAEAVEGTLADSQATVPFDAVTKHESGYVHLSESAEREIDGLEGSVTYGTDHAWYVDLGTSKMAAQPYLEPAFERNAKKLKAACEDLL